MDSLLSQTKHMHTLVFFIFCLGSQVNPSKYMQYHSPFAGHLGPSKLHKNHEISGGALRHQISPYEQHSRQVDLAPHLDKNGYIPHGKQPGQTFLVHKSFSQDDDRTPIRIQTGPSQAKSSELIQSTMQHLHATKATDLSQSTPLKYLDSHQPFLSVQRVGQHTEVIPQIDFNKIIEHNRKLYTPTARMQEELSDSELARTYAGPTNRQFGVISSRDFHQVNYRTFIDQLSFGRSSSAAGISTTPRVSVQVGAVRSN